MTFSLAEGWSEFGATDPHPGGPARHHVNALLRGGIDRSTALACAVPIVKPG